MFTCKPFKVDKLSQLGGYGQPIRSSKCSNSLHVTINWVIE